MNFITTPDGAKLWADVAGSGGEPVLLIAGNSVDRHGWDSVMEDFSAHHRVIRYDHRGTGQSDPSVPDGATTRDFAADAAAVIRGIGFQRVHVYGHSMGGRIAQWLAADHPDLVGALILGATTIGDSGGVPRPPEGTAALTGNDSEALRRMMYSDEWIAQNPDDMGFVAPYILSEKARAAHMRVSTGHDGRDAVGRITAPVLVIHGGDDRIAVPDNARILAQRITGAELLIIPGARHVYWAGFPQANTAILSFISAHPLAA